MIEVDGLQKLDHQSGSKTSVLYRVLSSLADESNSSGWPGHPFFIVCVAATESYRNKPHGLSSHLHDLMGNSILELNE